MKTVTASHFSDFLAIPHFYCHSIMSNNFKEQT